MSLTAVSSFVVSQIQGITTQYFPPLTVYLDPPPPGAVGVADGPKAFVFTTSTKEIRRTAPRGAGRKTVEHPLEVYVYAMLAIDEGQTVTKFQTLIDAVLAALRTAPVNASVTDPNTGAQSWVVAIGERMDVAIPKPTHDPNGGIYIWAAKLNVPVTESLTG